MNGARVLCALAVASLLPLPLVPAIFAPPPCPQDESENFCALWSEVAQLQFPENCRLRLLVQNFPSDTADVGDYLAAVVRGLAQAYHSNRTLIQGPTIATVVGVNGWASLFLPISHCSLNHLRSDVKHALLLRQEEDVWEGDVAAWANKVRGEVALSMSPDDDDPNLLVRVLHRFAMRVQPSMSKAVDVLLQGWPLRIGTGVHSALEYALPENAADSLMLTSVAMPLAPLADAKGLAVWTPPAEVSEELQSLVDLALLVRCSLIIASRSSGLARAAAALSGAVLRFVDAASGSRELRVIRDVTNRFAPLIPHGPPMYSLPDGMFQEPFPIVETAEGMEVNRSWFSLVAKAWKDGFRGSLGDWSAPGHRWEGNNPEREDWEIAGCDGMTAYERAHLEELSEAGNLSLEEIELAAEQARYEGASSLSRFSGGFFHGSHLQGTLPEAHLYLQENELIGTVPAVLGALPSIAEASRLAKVRHELELTMHYASAFLNREIRERNEWRELAFLVEAAFYPAPARDVQRRVSKVINMHFGATLMTWDERCPRNGGEGRYEESYRLSYLEKQGKTRRLPSEPQVFIDFGSWLVDERRYWDAIEPLKRAVQLNPENSWALMNLGTAYGEVGQMNDSLHYCYIGAKKANMHTGGLGHRLAGFRCYGQALEALGLAKPGGQATKDLALQAYVRALGNLGSVNQSWVLNTCELLGRRLGYVEMRTEERLRTYLEAYLSIFGPFCQSLILIGMHDIHIARDSNMTHIVVSEMRSKQAGMQAEDLSTRAARMVSMSRMVAMFPPEVCANLSAASKSECIGEFNFAETQYKGAALQAFRAWWPKRYVLGDECWRLSLKVIDTLGDLENKMPELDTVEVKEARGFFKKYHYAILRNVLSRSDAARCYAYHAELIDERCSKYHDKQGRRYERHSDRFDTYLQAVMRPLISAVVGRELAPTYTYTATYVEGATLRTHHDRTHTRYSANMALGQSGEEPWTLYFDPISHFDRYKMGQSGLFKEMGDVDGADLPGEVNATIYPGDVFFYSGSGHFHYRKPNPHKRSAHSFLMYMEEYLPLDPDGSTEENH